MTGSKTNTIAKSTTKPTEELSSTVMLIKATTGKIKAVGAGKCYIYVYTNNGVSKKITVTVK